MIVFIKGKVLSVSLNEKNSYVEVLTEAGLGYRIAISSFDAANLITDDEIQLYTSFQVREDSQTLYGFSQIKSRGLFERLIDISGIGPKVAMSVLSTFEEEQLEQILLAGDYKALSKASGLGQKGAKKIILELQGKLELEPQNKSEGAGVIRNSDLPLILQDLYEALESLGYKGGELERKIILGQKVYEDDSNVSIEDLLSRVLKS